MNHFVNSLVTLCERHGRRVLGPTVYQSTREKLAKITESSEPSEGIYYVVRTPTGWEAHSYRYDEFPLIDHTEFWESYVVPVLAHKWSKIAGIKPRELEAALNMYPYAFPRGRVSDARYAGKGYIVNHGKDLPVGVSKSTINRLFSLPPTTPWDFDNHEQCSVNDRDEVRRLLCIKDTWPAVDHVTLS